MSQMPPPAVQPGYQGPMPGAPKPAGMAIASMVLGIISAISFCIWYLSIPCGIIAVVLGMVAKGKVRTGEGGGGGMATAGLVLGIIGLVLAVVWVIALLAGLSWITGKAAEIQKQQQQRMQQGGSAMLPTEHISAIWNILGSLIWR